MGRVTIAVRSADRFARPPRIVVRGRTYRYGTADTVVARANAALIVGQWRDVHGIRDGHDHVVGQVHLAWHDAAGRAAIDEYVIAGMGHGTLISTTGADACGTIAPYFLAFGISSTYRIVTTWALFRRRHR